MELKGRYDDYIETLHKILLPILRGEPRTEIIERQWRQLCVAAHVFGLKFTEVLRFAAGVYSRCSLFCSLRQPLPRPWCCADRTAALCLRAPTGRRSGTPRPSPPCSGQRQW